MVLSPVRILKPNLYESGCVLYLTEDSVDGSTWEDLSGYKNHGAINGATLVSGSGLYFDGTDDYVDCGNNSVLDVTNTDRITIRVKTKIEFQQYIVYGIVTKRETTTDRNYETYCDGADNTFKFYIRTGDTVGSISSNTLQSNVFYTFTSVYDGSSIKIYTEDTLSNYESRSGEINSYNVNLCIGCRISSGSPISYFKGYIKEVYIYNKPFNQSKIFAHNRNSRFLPNRVIV